MGKTNKHELKIYQFVDSTKVRELAYINAILNYKAVVCFDLEDSIKTNEINFNKIRAIVLSDIFEFVINNKNIELGIRINPIKSKFFLDDIIQLSKFLSSQCHINFFLPKVSDSLDISTIIDEANSHGLQNFEIIPIIESKQGIENLRSIISNNTGYISKIAFGHCDYNYDCDYFPFHHHDSEIYWEWINEISQTCGDEITLLNSPYLNLKHDEYLFRILSRLKKVTNKSGQITLSLRQSKVCNLFNQRDYQLLNIPETTSNEVDINQFAMNLIHSFEQYKVDGKNFAIIPNIKKLISPQEYAKAKRIIWKND